MLSPSLKPGPWRIRSRAFHTVARTHFLIDLHHRLRNTRSNTAAKSQRSSPGVCNPNADTGAAAAADSQD